MSPQNIENDPEFEYLKRKRHEAFIALDEGKIRAYMDSCDIKTPSHKDIFWKGVHMARAAMCDIPMKVREESIDWMIDNSTLLPFIMNVISKKEQKDLLMRFYEVRNDDQPNS